MTDGLDPARALLPGERLHLVQAIKSGDRTTVRRIEATDARGTLRSLVVKEYHDAGEGWLRESAALASVPGAVRVPAVVAAGADPAILIMEDLGSGASLADDLLGDDPAAAAESVVGWAEALAELHSATRNSRAAFASAIAQRGGGQDVGESWLPNHVRESERLLDRHCGALGVTIPSGAMTELTGLLKRLGPDGAAAVTPADTCPDNNMLVGKRRVLVDFEAAEWRHIAWDVAYLLVPWPGCWCAWRLPDTVVERAVARYREVAAPAFPAVADDAFERDVQAAAVGWVLMGAAWSLDLALAAEIEPDHQPVPYRPTPRRRALIMHRLGRAAASPELPALAELAGGLHGVLLSRWGDVPLDVAPAFRGR